MFCHIYGTRHNTLYNKFGDYSNGFVYATTFKLRAQFTATQDIARGRAEHELYALRT